jgi:ComEC/Rec2-related protein
MRRRLTPALALFCAFLTVLLVFPRTGSRAAVAAALVAAAAAIALVAAADPIVRRAGMLLASAAVGFALGAGSLARMNTALEGGSLTVSPTAVTGLSGVLRADSMLSVEGDTILRVRVREAQTRDGISAAVRANVLVFVRGDWRFSSGETLAIRGELEPFDSTGPERYATRVDRDRVRRIGFASAAWRSRARIREGFHRAIAGIGYPASALLEALLIGAREDVPLDLREGFRATGSLHVLALSGLHAGIVFAFVAALLRPLRNHYAAFLAGSVLLAGYLFVAGFMPSLVRAVIMLTVGGAARLADRDDEPLNLLAISGIVILAADPFAAATLSFQFSFLALAGILALGPIIARPLEGKVPRLLATPLAASAGAQAATLPVVLIAFGAWYPSGILAALLLVPLVTVFLWMGLAWLAIFPLAGRLAVWWAAGVFDALYRVIAGVTGILARVPGVVVKPASAPAWAVAAGLVALAAAVLLPRGARSECPWAR